MRTLLLGLLVGMIIALLAFLTSPILRDIGNRLRQSFYGWQLGLLARTLDAQMVAATAVVINDRPAGHHFTGTFSLDPGSIAAGGREVDTVAIPGLAVGDVVIVRNRTAVGLIPTAERVSAAGALEIVLENNTAGAIDAGAQTYDFAVLRGSTGPLRNP